MAVAAFHLHIDLDPGGFNPSDREVNHAKLNARERARERIIEHFGGDPLPSQQFQLQTNIGVAKMLWRARTDNLQLPEVIERVHDLVKSLPPPLFPIVQWELRYHICNNGQNRPCKPWEVIAQGEGRGAPGSRARGGRP